MEPILANEARESAQLVTRIGHNYLKRREELVAADLGDHFS